MRHEFPKPISTLGTVVISDHLYQIDSATSIATLLGPIDLNLSAVADVNGIFYAFNSGTGQIVTLDLANGQMSLVGNFDLAGIVTGTTATPESASVALAVFGIAGLALV